jgi:predicted HTH domain antitoxin
MAIIEVSRELELATHMSAQEIRRELAVHLYTQGKLSAGKARELADMDVVAFQSLLGSRGIPVNYGVEDFQADLEMTKRLAADQ